MNELSIKKYDYIDALRGFAILGVVLLHSSQWASPALDIYARIANQGARGVQLFYMASALTLFLSIEAREKQEKRPLLNFYIRRFFRIAPLFYVAIISYMFYNGMEARYTAPNGIKWWYILLTALFLNGWHPETINSVVPGGWSIAIEMTFYLFVPFLFRKLNNFYVILMALLGSLIAANIFSGIVTSLLTPHYPEGQQHLIDSFTYMWFFSQLPVFILGILLYHLIKKYPVQNKVIGLLFLLVSFILFAVFLKANILGGFLPQYFLYGVAFLFFSLSLYFWPNPLFVNKATVFIGKMSFGIYLAHFMVIKIMRSVFSNGFILDGNKGFALGYLLVVTLSLIAAYAANKLIELPGIKLGGKIIKQLD